MKIRIIIIAFISIISTLLIFNYTVDHKKYLVYISDRIDNLTIPTVINDVDNYIVIDNLKQKEYRISDVISDIEVNKEISTKKEKLNIQNLLHKNSVILLDLGSNEINTLEMLGYSPSYIVSKIKNEYSSLISILRHHNNQNIIIKRVNSNFEVINKEVNSFLDNVSKFDSRIITTN